MNNFWDFINDDITAKKTLISTMPTKTKTNIKKYNAALTDIENKYGDYKLSVRNYLLAKSKSFEIDVPEKDLIKLNQRITTLEHVKFLLNPFNTYFEKMGFDGLLYQVNNYYVFNFKSLDGIINGFLDKFEMAGIRLDTEDFTYTCYVHQYMTCFLEVRYKKASNYDKVAEIFEQIYWINPEIIEHIELNFRKLIRKNARKFEAYILKLQRKVMDDAGVKNYQDCVEQLDKAYIQLNVDNRETVADIIGLAKIGELDINQYMPDSKVRKTAYDSLIIDKVDRTNEDSMDKIYTSLEKLKLNIDEYNSYINFLPMMEDFKTEYTPLLPKEEDKTKKEPYGGLKNIIDNIEKRENELEKINRKIFGNKFGLFDFGSNVNLKQLKIESVRKAKELSESYKEYDKEYFKNKVLSILNNNLTVSDLLDLYFSYDYFKKLAIQRVFNLTDYDEIIKYSDTFDLFAMDPTTIIVDGLPIFDESNIPKIIANKYRLSSIKLNEEDLVPENLTTLINKILLILRVHKIETSKTNMDKIWFMVNVEKIIHKEQKELEAEENK